MIKIDTVKTVSSNPTVAITVKYDYPDQYEFIDTTSQSELLSKFKASYDTSEYVFIASIYDAKSFTTPHDSLMSFSFAESVTVKIEKVFKGSISFDKKIFVCNKDGISGRNMYDSIKRQYEDIIREVSERMPDYATMIGKRFLLFLSKTEMESCDLTIDKPGVCVFQFYKYMIDENDQLYFDGIVIDREKKQVINLFCLKIDLVSVVNFFSSTPIHKKGQPGVNAVLLENITSYNLLGRQFSLPRFPRAKLHTANIIISKDKSFLAQPRRFK